VSLLNQGYTLFKAITLSDTVDILTGLTDAIYVGTKGSTGTIVAVMEDGTTGTFVGVTAGTIYPLRVRRINNTTTDASNLVALYIK
jgi:hypothetical protein